MAFHTVEWSTEAKQQNGAGERGVIAVERALLVVDAFTAEKRSLTLAEISRSVGLSKPTVLRLAKTLAGAGYLVRNEDASWRLGPKLARLGALYHAGFRLEEQVIPFLRRLSAETGESAAFYVRDGSHRICLARVDTQQSVGYRAKAGDIFPLDRGAPGHVLLAFGGEPGILYDTIRRDFHHATFGERDPQVSSLAYPVFRLGRQLAGAMVVVGPTNRFDAAAVARYLGPLREIAGELTKQLGGQAGDGDSTEGPGRGADPSGPMANGHDQPGSKERKQC